MGVYVALKQGFCPVQVPVPGQLQEVALGVVGVNLSTHQWMVLELDFLQKLNWRTHLACGEAGSDNPSMHEVLRMHHHQSDQFDLDFRMVPGLISPDMCAEAVVERVCQLAQQYVWNKVHNEVILEEVEHFMAHMKEQIPSLRGDVYTQLLRHLERPQQTRQWVQQLWSICI